MKPSVILNNKQLQLTINRLSYQLVEIHENFKDTVIIGLQPRGVLLAKRVVQKLFEIVPKAKINYGELDITFFRDDFRRRETVAAASETNIDFEIEGKSVILVDDVLYTGRSIRAGMDALLTFGRPKNIELMVLVDRRFSRHIPLQANYVGKMVDAIASQYVTVEWGVDDNNRVILSSELNDNE